MLSGGRVGDPNKSVGDDAASKLPFSFCLWKRANFGCSHRFVYNTPNASYFNI